MFWVLLLVFFFNYNNPVNPHFELFSSSYQKLRDLDQLKQTEQVRFDRDYKNKLIWNDK